MIEMLATRHGDAPGAADALPTRSSLLSRLRDWDDAESWREFFGRYRRFIHGLALKCGLTHPEADEVMQETMLTVARQMPEFRYDPAIGTFKGWLFAIARRCISRQFALRQPVSGRVDIGDENGALPHALSATATELFESQWEEEWRRSLLSMAMERVRRRAKPRQFQMFDLYVTQQMPMPQVRRLLNVNAAQVYMAKLRVGALLRREVGDLKAKLI
jgi:RNA polymerase sigma-70 factor (ECF subfamily)